MEFIRKVRKGVIVTLTLVMLISSLSSFAETARFKDVPKMIDKTKNWSYDYIERVADLKYMKGTSNDKFSPKSILTFEQAIVLLGRFTNPTSEDLIKANSEYNSFLTGLKVTNWAVKDMEVAIYNGIISKEEIENVYKNKKGDKAITKIATSVYLVRAMGLADEAESKNMVSLTYRDSLEMSTVEMKYLSMLIETGVLDPKGSGSGLFQPKSSLTREVMAKMLVTAYEYLDDNIDKPKEPDKPIDPDKPKDPEEIEKITSVIISPLSKIGNKNFIIVDDGNGKQEAYEIGSTASITLDGKPGTYLDLDEGQEVELIIKKGTREAIFVRATSLQLDVSGKIKTVNSNSNKLTIEHIVDKKDVSTEYNVDKDARIYLDDKNSNLKDLNEGDEIKIKIKNGAIYDIEAKSKIQKIEGIIKELSEVKDSKDKEYYITIVDSKDISYKFLINGKTEIYRNDRKTYEPTDLRIKDEAYINAEYGVALSIEANVVKKRVRGIIIAKNTRLHEKAELTILDKETKKEEIYVIGQTPYIRVDGIITNTFDLKVGYYVELLIEGEEIIELDADSRAAEVAIMGTVSYINTRNMEMIITIESFDLDVGKYGDEITVYLKLDVVVIDRLGEKMNLDDIRRGDRVNVIGSYDGNSIIADTIQVR